MATHDSLTGLPNRVMFNDLFTLAIAQAYRNQKKVGLMFLYMDQFKDVNDTLRHDVGDELLKSIVIYPRDGKDANTLLEKADIAMYKAKKYGRNKYQYYVQSTKTES